MADKTLTDFLTHTVSQKSLSLLLVDNATAARMLQKEGFSELKELAALTAAGKYFIKAKGRTPQELYELAVQYGSGQIEQFDLRTGVPTWINPAYHDSSLVLVASKDEVINVEKEGLPLLSNVGLSLQL